MAPLPLATSLLVVSRATLVVAVLWLGGCATAPEFDTAGVEAQLTPQRAVALGEQALGRRVQWGGTIVAVRNLADHTRLEVLAYPLADDGFPDLRARARGRFLMLRRGYLEPVDFAPGRQLTAVGTVTRIEQGRVGEAPYPYPVMEAHQLHLWPASRAHGRGGPRVHFGIGVILH